MKNFYKFTNFHKPKTKINALVNVIIYDNYLFSLICNFTRMIHVFLY